jgi:hypothetical protein
MTNKMVDIDILNLKFKGKKFFRWDSDIIIKNYKFSFVNEIDEDIFKELRLDTLNIDDENANEKIKQFCEIYHAPPPTIVFKENCVFGFFKLDDINFHKREENRYVDNKEKISKTKKVIPIDIKPNFDDEKYDLIDGNHRCFVCKEIGYNYIPAFICFPGCNGGE